MWLQGFAMALSGLNPLFLLLGTVIGLVVGVLPAVGPSFAVTLALPFTFGLDVAAALILLTAIQSACAYGDSIASILINVPGGPGTVATMWEGHPMARAGRAGTALGIATGASFVGGVIGWLSFVLLAGPMTTFALVIGAPEYFVLGLMALTLISIASRGETLKGLVMGCLGLLFGMIGADPVSGVTYRFTLGLPSLEPGVDIILGALAIFALPQLVVMLEEGGTIGRVPEMKDSVLGGVMAALRRPATLLRGGLIGWLVGVLPALGTSAAGITSYLVEKRVSKRKEEFGHGSVDGLTAAEVGKGACVMGDGITSLMLGVPGSVTWAILMAALIVHGVQPGPRFMTAGVLPYTVFAGLLLGQLAYLILGVLTVKHLARIVYIPNHVLAPIVAVLCFLGAFVAKNYVFDIWIMVALGLFAFAAQRNGYPTVPMILGFILADLVESNFHRALAVGFGSYDVFFDRPISLAMIVITLLFLAWPWLAWVYRRWRGDRGGAVATAVAETEDREAGAPAGRELVFGGVVAVLLLSYLVTAFRYAPDVRLFPVIVSVAGLVLVGGWFASALRKRRVRGEVAPGSAGKGATGDRAVPALVTLGLLVGYALLVPVAGFVLASVVWFLAVSAVSRYLTAAPRWPLAGAVAAGLAVFLVGFARLLQVDLPTGLLGF